MPRFYERRVSSKDLNDMLNRRKHRLKDMPPYKSVAYMAFGFTDDTPSFVINSLKLIYACNLERLQVHLQRFPSAIRELNDRVPVLHLALNGQGCSAAIVKLLLDYGADPNSEWFGNRYGGNPDFKWIGNRYNPLYSALNCRDRVGIIRVLVEGGTRANELDGWIEILREAFCKNAELEVIKLLLRAGAELTSADNFGVKSLFQALRYFNVSVFTCLLDLQNVEDINTVRNNWNGSLLHSALSKDGCPAVFVKFLIDRGIRVDSVDGFGDTPLHVAVRERQRHMDVVDMLLRKGSLVDVKNQKSETPLDIAVQAHFSIDIVRLLLKYCLLQNPDFDVEDSVCGQELEEMFSRYANDYKCELQRMNSENVGDGRTLFEFLHAYSGSQMIRTGEEGFDVDIVLQIISGKRYPLYSSVISSKLERSLLKEKIEEYDIFIVVEDRSDVRCVTRKVSLNKHCIEILAKFLDDNDLLNMIMAYFN